MHATRFRVLIFNSLNLCGCVALFVSSLPAVNNASAKVAGLVIAMFFLGLGTGGVRTTVSPFIGTSSSLLSAIRLTLTIDR